MAMLAGPVYHVSYYLCAGNIHSSGIESMLDLSRVVHLKDVVSTKLNVVRQLAVLKEVNHERHLANWSSCIPNAHVFS